MTISYHPHRLLLTTVLTFAACTPSPLHDPPITVTSTEAGPDACAVAEAVCKARLIRAPNGSALCPPCPK